MIHPPLWTNEFFIDHIERTIKRDISMYFHVNHERNPSKEEYEEYFKKYIDQLKCNITDFDLGIFND